MGYTIDDCDCCGGGTGTGSGGACLPDSCDVTLTRWYVHFPLVGGMDGCCDTFDGQVVAVDYFCRIPLEACVWRSAIVGGCVVELRLSSILGGQPTAVVSIYRDPDLSVTSGGDCVSGSEVAVAIWQEESYGNNKPVFQCLGDNLVPWFGQQLGSAESTDCDEFVGTNVTISPNP